MKKIKLSFVMATISLCMLHIFSCQSSEKEQAAVFNYFEYKGADATFASVDSVKEYQNPVLSGFYPDPSICRKGNDYYLVTSSFAYYPGIPIFHSTDLVNWVQLGHVLNRPSQLQLDGIRLDGGVYAPTIRYNPYNDTFYLINTCVDGIGNFIVKTKDPKQNNWSEPIALPKVGGIDPDIFFDEDGKAYIVHNDAPQGEPEWNGHRAIWIHEYDVNADTTLGTPKVIVDGGTDKAKRPIWIEAPHLYKINGYYYLMCAEGGTGVDHSEVIFRADKVEGPYIPWKNNPVLTQRDLPADRPNPVTCAGHADLVQTPEGGWYAVFLACRPYEDNYFNTGRETFLLPVEWNDGYPVILPKGAAIPYTVDKPGLSPDANSYKGNFAWRDEFDTDVLNNRWLFIRTPLQTPWWSIADGQLKMTSTGHTIYEEANPAFIGARQQHLTFEAQTELAYAPAKEGDIAGLVCYQNQAYNFVFGKTVNGQGKPCIILNRSLGTVARLAEVEIPDASAGKPLTLKITGNKDKYSFFASYDKGETWLTIAENADAKNLSTQVAGGFTGVVLGMYMYTNPAPKKEPLSPWTKGAFETQKYRNLFAEAGYTEQETETKLNDLFHQVFEGENKVYFEVNDSMAYVSDIKNSDVRTEGMSYGMMVAVQFNRKDIFDKLWRWGVKYMQHHEGPYKGYFAWSCKIDGTRNAQGPASDGELYYVTSLIFAANRWGNDSGINYLKEAQYILDCAFAKNASDGGITNFIDTTHKLINFTPEAFWGATFTDPSYHIPAFYEVWARWANDGRSEFWRQCAQKTREYLHKSVHPVTAINADQNEFDGSIRENKLPNGMVIRNEAFRFDSWRVPMNIALDYSWCCEDREWQREYGHKFQNFLYLQGVKTFVDQYNMDGSLVQWILPAGGKVKLRHSIGLVATSAAISLACTHPKSYEFIDHFWHSENKPYDDGYFDAYYDGFLQLFAFMHLSGNYKIIFPEK
ncbi:MAG: family 43 glycosylhydrolase [Prevotellaceae bacterium]|jgi:alpha-N-arabinofuranosidase|nr:family 43 glycosylhydrolase [Prevotellaceae bacterium]